jgi:hypothetical protein
MLNSLSKMLVLPAGSPTPGFLSGRSTPGLQVGGLIIAIFLAVFPALAQQQSPEAPQQSSTQQLPPAASPSSDSSKANATPNADPAVDPEPANVIKNDRLFGVLPNYTTVENEQQFGPLTVKAKFKLAADSSFDPYTFPFIGFIALIGQAQNSEPSYGQGLKGYAKRYGTSYGDAIIGTFMTTSVMPSLLHEDPRYFQLGTGSLLHRITYSASRIVITRTDSGGRQFNYSEIGGNLVAAGISNIYHPAEDRTISNTLSV